MLDPTLILPDQRSRLYTGQSSLDSTTECIYLLGSVGVQKIYSKSFDIENNLGEACDKTCDYSPPCFGIKVDDSDIKVKSQCIPFIRNSAACNSGKRQ